jgi:CRISPR-associated endonuclease Csn1
MRQTSLNKTVLGLDLGSNSLGWALLEFEGNKPKAIIDCGVRIFKAGLEGDIESGNAVSRARERREKRSLRRQTDRKKRRRGHLFHLLQELHLLPEGTQGEVFPSLDKSFIEKYSHAEGLPKKILASKLPYWLRARALEHSLEPYELGRVIYHLGKRRGFLSNRKTPAKQEEGIVAKEISELRDEMKTVGARTLGEYLAGLDPQEERIRSRYTQRGMFQEEFEAICTFQKKFHHGLNEDNIARIGKTIFFQRPLKSAKKLVGHCELEPNSRRAPWATLEAQQFRYLQMVNNCSIKTKDDLSFRPFTDPERTILIDHLEQDGDLTFAKAKKLMGKESKTTAFSFEAGEESRFLGNRINKALKGIFGNDWFAFDKEKKESILADLRSYRDAQALAKRAQEVWGLDSQKAQEFASIELEPGYCALSRKAIKKLLPYLEQGVPYASARIEVYGALLKPRLAEAFLLPVKQLFEIRNPVVERSLTELRKVVNSVIRKHGKPDRVKIELAREMKQSQKKRKEITRTNRLNEKRRQEAAQKITKEVGIKNPSRNDILKVMLGEECNWICPYTSKSISMMSLFGDSPQFDIEHIVPFSRSFDDSFANKTLCHVDENRAFKRNRSPWEAYHGSPKWEDMLDNVKRFKGDLRDSKLERFLKRPEELEDLDGFISRQMNDTRYASKLAMHYLGTLYGGLYDKEKHQRVFAVTGRVTSILRNAWSMNSILNDGGVKERGDHRHHAVDAVAIALTSPTTIRGLSEAALPSYERNAYRKRFKPFQMPWPTFFQDLENRISGILVSHRVNHRVNAALHEETNYGIVKASKEKCFCIRRKLDSLRASEIDQIIDKRIAQIIRDKLSELKQTDPSKAFVSTENHPYFVSAKGETIWIHKVRIYVSTNANKLGDGLTERYVTPRSNHHMEIFEVTDLQDPCNKRWECEVVDTLGAMDRLRKGQPVVRKEAEGKRFLFSIATGDTLKLHNPGEWPEYLHVRKVSKTLDGRMEIAGVSINDARLKKDIVNTKEFYRIASVIKLQNLDPQKVTVLPCGEVLVAKG